MHRVNALSYPARSISCLARRPADNGYKRMNRFTHLVAGLLAVILWPAVPAQAAWLKAESAHFVVYADDSERDLMRFTERFTERLERYHAALEIITGLDLPDPSPSNRVTVYVARNEREIRRLFGDANSSVAGFYIGRAGSSAAFVPRLSTTGFNGEVSPAIDPVNVNAHIQKGYALMRMAAAIEDDQAARVVAYRAAAEPFQALNALENEHPLRLLYYYRSFTQSGRTPGNSARAGLVRALEIAPFDFSLRMEAVMMHLRAGAFAEAGPALQPIAFSPHGGPLAAQATAVLDRIGQGNLGEDAGQELIDLLTTNPAAEAAAAEEG